MDEVRTTTSERRMTMETGFRGLMRIDWRWVLARGALGVAFGILLMLSPGVAMLSVALIFAFYVFMDGIMALSGAWALKKHGQGWGLLALEGALGVIAGAVALVYPVVALVTMAFIIGAWAMITGVLAVISAFQHKEHIGSPVLLGLSGVVSFIFGIVVVARPIAGAAALIFLLSAYAIIYGGTMAIWAFQLRRHQVERIPAGRRTEVHVT